MGLAPWFISGISVLCRRNGIDYRNPYEAFGYGIEWIGYGLPDFTCCDVYDGNSSGLKKSNSSKLQV